MLETSRNMNELVLPADKSFLSKLVDTGVSLRLLINRMHDHRIFYAVSERGLFPSVKNDGKIVVLRFADHGYLISNSKDQCFILCSIYLPQANWV